MAQAVVAGLSPRRSGSIHVGFVLGKAAVGQVFLKVLQFFRVNIVPPMIHIHSFTYHQHYMTAVSDRVVK